MSASPYRQPPDLAALIPADRRWVKWAALAAVCFAAGLVARPACDGARDAITDVTVAWTLGTEGGRPCVPELDPRWAELPSLDEAKPLARMPGIATTAEARDALLTDPAFTKHILLPIVASGLGSDEDVRVLRAACTGLDDDFCLMVVRTPPRT